METALHDLRNKDYKRLNEMLLYVELETSEKDIKENDEVVIDIEGRAVKYSVATIYNGIYRLVFLQYL